MGLEGGNCILWSGGGKEGVCQTLLQPPVETQGPVFSFHPSEETAKECLCVCINYCNVLTLENSMKGVQQGYGHFDIDTHTHTHTHVYKCASFPLFVSLFETEQRH